MKESSRFNVSLSFEGIRFPPFEDILLLGRRCPQGKAGVSKCLNLIAPEKFELVEIDDPVVEAMLINKVIIKRMPVEKVIKILKAKVFPLMTNGEIVKVDFNVMIYFDGIEGVLKEIK
ncbi:MAG TPA: hypothetical protein VMW78_08640 [Anaerolineae bacterium]|nr:hypothetical protein [Anaerolineae bacterium]